MMAAAVWGAGGPQLAGRISGKQGVRNARQWTIEVRNSGSDAALGARIGAVRFTQTSAGGGASCTPAIRHPRFPVELGDIPAGGTATASLTIDFRGCANRAQFTVEMDFSDSSGAVRGTLRRSNDYR
jgi:hypothetical protein